MGNFTKRTPVSKASDDNRRHGGVMSVLTISASPYYDETSPRLSRLPDEVLRYKLLHHKTDPKSKQLTHAFISRSVQK